MHLKNYFVCFVQTTEDKLTKPNTYLNFSLGRSCFLRYNLMHKNQTCEGICDAKKHFILDICVNKFAKPNNEQLFEKLVTLV